MMINYIGEIFFVIVLMSSKQFRFPFVRAILKHKGLLQDSIELTDAVRG